MPEIPIEIQEWLPMPPELGPPLPEFLHIYWPWYKPPGAEFRVSNLVISPAEVQLGYSVTISSLVENIGTEVGTKTVVCKVEGEIMAEQSVTLEPAESRTIAFEVTPTVAKSYSVSVDGLYGSFIAVEAPVAQFAYVSSVKRVPIDSTDCFSVDVQNTGEVTGTCTLECMEKHKVEGDYTDWQITTTISHTLAPGEIRTFGDNNEFCVWTTGAPRHEKWYVSFRGEPGEIGKSGSAW